MREGKIEFICRVQDMRHTAYRTTEIGLRPQIPPGRDVGAELVPGQISTLTITGEHYIRPCKFVRVTIEEVDPETLPAYDPA